MVETIVAALVGGLAASSGKIASKAVEDGYAGLKTLLVRKLGAESDAVEAVKKLEDNPDSEARKVVVYEELRNAKIGDDTELAEAANRLQGALKELPATAQTHVQNALGSYIALASGGSTASVTIGAPLKP